MNTNIILAVCLIEIVKRIAHNKMYIFTNTKLDVRNAKYFFGVLRKSYGQEFIKTELPVKILMI